MLFCCETDMNMIKYNMTKRKIQLDGKTWLQYSISIWSDIRKSNEEIALKHPALFPVMLAKRLISIYSYKNDKILDPFSGVGSTLVAAQSLQRYSYGIELSEEYVKKYKKRTAIKEIFTSLKHEPVIIQDDANNLLKYIKEKSIKLTITSPPYWDILNQKRTADYKRIRKYSDNKLDLGNIESYEEFIKALKNIFAKVYKVTKKNGFCCIILMDLRKRDKFYPFHVDTIKFMTEIGFTLDDIIIWDRRQEYNNLRPLGYPYVFRINKVHEYILIFKK